MTRRPRYESAEDREREDAVAAWAASLRDAEQAAFPVGSTCDRVLVKDGRVLALLEVKCRHTPSRMYPDYCVSEERATFLRYVGARLKVPALLVVDWLDARGMLDLRSTQPSHVKAGGRYDRNDEWDKEPMLHFRIEDFFLRTKQP